MLDELPETLDETYERILRDINKANWDHAHRLLQCLTVAVRPLHVAELAEVLAVDFGTDSRGGTSKLNMDWRWEDQQEAVLSTCSSLISVVNDYGGQVVQFSHFSVKEFLISSRISESTSAGISRFHILSEPAHAVLARACLGVLLRLGEVVDEDNVEDNVEDKFPLARYAAEHWVDHTRIGNVLSHIREEIEYLFDPDKPYIDVWVQVHDIDTKPYSDSVLYWLASSTTKNSNTATPLYYAALCGFHDLAKQLIVKCPQDVNAAGGFFVSPLGAALSAGHFKIAQLLYEHGAEVDVQGRNNYTLLNAASRGGHLDIVQWLLRRGANPHVRDKRIGWTPLHASASIGHVEISELLLEYKADSNAHDNKGRTPLYEAVRCAHGNVARMLPGRGTDGRETPSRFASDNGFLDVARLLVEHGANIDTEDHEVRTVFQDASGRGHHDLVRFLSESTCSK